MKEKLLKLIEDLTTIDNLIEYRVNDFIVDDEYWEDKSIEYDNPKSKWFEKEINDFFSELYFEIAAYTKEQRRVYGKGLLFLFEKHFLYQKNYFFKCSDELEQDFYINFEDVPYNPNEFNERKKEAIQRSVKYIYNIKERIEELCELSPENNKELENREETEIKKEIEKNKPLLKRLKWIGTPAQFGFMINELIGKGYIERPTGSFNKDAEFYLSLFDINTTVGNLANEVNENKNSLTGTNAAKFTIPHKDKLS